MISIKKCIEQIVLDTPFLEDALYNDYLNLSSFALYIKPRVEQMCKKEVTIGSIKITLSRISKKYQKDVSFKIIKTDNIFIRKNVHLVSIHNSKLPQNFLNNVSSKISFTEKNYFGMIRGTSETDIIYSSNLHSTLRPLIDDSYIKMEVEDVSAIGIHIDEDLFDTQGIIYNLIKKLAFYNINIFAISSTYTELIFVIKKKDLEKAFEVFLV